MQADRWYIGADVGKSEIVVASYGGGGIAPQTVLNTRLALGHWLKSLPTGSCMAVEASGGYHTLLADMAHEHGLEVYVLNPKHVLHYAKALGGRGKTDRMDAQVIARYLAREYGKLHRYEPESDALRRLRELQALRSAVVKSATLLRLSCERLQAADTGDQVQTLLEQMHRISDQMQAELVKRIKGDAEMAQGFALLFGITGIGALTATALTTMFVRVPFESSDAVVAYCGLDPRPKESGRMVGVRRLSKQGDKRVRALLYNAATASVKNPVFRQYYEALRSRGLPSTAALVVISRKLLRIAYGVWRTKQPFDLQAVRISTGLT